MVRDYYGELGVKPQASPEEIKGAYRRLAREFHPDINPRPEAVARFRAISIAHEVLSNPLKRQIVDLGGDPVSPDDLDDPLQLWVEAERTKIQDWTKTETAKIDYWGQSHIGIPDNETAPVEVSEIMERQRQLVTTTRDRQQAYVQETAQSHEERLAKNHSLALETELRVSRMQLAATLHMERLQVSSNVGIELQWRGLALTYEL